MSKEFDLQNKSQWKQQISRLFPHGAPHSASWTHVREMARTLQKVCSPIGLNHTLLPILGGVDMIRAVPSTLEHRCLELWAFRDMIYLCRPQVLHFRHIEDAPEDSFFLLECARLEHSGLYPSLDWPSEEVTELPDGSYVEHSFFQNEYLDFDENDEPIPLPRGSRSVTRYFSGKFLLAAKRGLWNQCPRSYDALHNDMTADEIQHALNCCLLDPKFRRAARGYTPAKIPARATPPAGSGGPVPDQGICPSIQNP